MLARLSREIPVGDYFYEPKWDGFRCLAFRTDGEVDLRSRHDRPFARYFPEIVEQVEALPGGDIVLDGELVVVRDGRFDFDALMNRLHPAASRVARLRVATPAAYIAFDMLERDGAPLLDAPFERRRAALTDVLGTAEPPIFVTPATTDVRVAESWLARYQGAGVDGVVAKARELRYLPGRARWSRSNTRRRPSAWSPASGRCSTAGRWSISHARPVRRARSRKTEHVGVVVGLPAHQRRSIYELLAPLQMPLAGHPWEHGFLLEGGAVGRLRGSAGRWTPEMSHDWVPVRRSASSSRIRPGRRHPLPASRPI